MVRAKQRYIVAEVRADKSLSFHIDSEMINKQIREKIQQFWGDYGYSCLLRLNIKYLNDATRICIIQVNFDAIKFVTSTLPLLTVVGKALARLRILYVGATIKQCKKFIIKHHTFKGFKEDKLTELNALIIN